MYFVNEFDGYSLFGFSIDTGVDQAEGALPDELFEFVGFSNVMPNALLGGLHFYKFESLLYGKINFI